MRHTAAIGIKRTYKRSMICASGGVERFNPLSNNPLALHSYGGLAQHGSSAANDVISADWLGWRGR
jgi:hypothetical protein